MLKKCLNLAVKKLKNINISILVAGIMMFLAFVTVFGISWYVSEATIAQGRQATGEQLQERAIEITEKMEISLDERVANVKAMASSPTLRNPAASSATKQDVADVIANAYEQFKFIAITDAEGNLVAQSGRHETNQNASDEQWFREAMSARNGEVALVDVHSLASAPDDRVIDISTVYRDVNGATRGVVMGQLDFDWITKNIDNLTDSERYKKQRIEIRVLNRDNLVLLSPVQSEIGKVLELRAVKQADAGRSGFTQEKMSEDGQSYIYGYYGDKGFNNYPGLGWKTLVSMPTESASANLANEVSRLRLTGIVLGIFIALTTALGVWQVIRHRRRIEEAQTSFISMASHQLRIPATSIKLQLDLILNGYVTSKKEILEIIKEVYESNDSQERTIEDLLNIAALESGKLTLDRTEVDIKQLVENAIKEHESLKKPNQTIHLKSPRKKILASVDEGKIRMSVANLLSNAIKYTQEDGDIYVNLHLTKRDTVVISVRDTGIGISKKDRGKIFARFSRVHNRFSSKAGGTGLGLYMTRQFMELHQGTISLKSAPGKGSTFILEFPICQKQQSSLFQSEAPCQIPSSYIGQRQDSIASDKQRKLK